MRKLKYILTAILLSFSLAGCNDEIPQENPTLPNVDIVERSELLDMVTIDYVLHPYTQKTLENAGVAVSLSDFELTADKMAQFVLTFVTEYGDYKYRFNAVIDYTTLANGKFTDVRLYWGNVRLAEKGLLINSLYDYSFLPLDKKAEDFVPHHLTFIKDKGGYITHASAGFGRYAFTYRTDAETGVAVFDTSGKMLSNLVQKVKNHNTDIPFSYAGQFDGEFVNENLFIKKVREPSITDMRLYDISANTLSDSLYTLCESLVDGDTTYTVYEIFNANGDDISIGYSQLAVKNENGHNTAAVLYDTKGYMYVKQSDSKLSVTKDGKLVCHSQPTGLQATIDFENGSCEKGYLISDDMLGEKIATSKDEKYSLYEYGLHSHNNYDTSYLALKDETTGENSFVGAYKADGVSKAILDTGFFSNGDIYLLTDYDFKIFTTDTVKNGPVFSIGEKFPLGVAKENGVRCNTLHAARRDPENGSFIVVYDHLGSDKYYTGPFDKNNENLFSDNYEVTLLDKNGDVVQTFTTEMPVPAGNYPLNISLSGNLLTMENVDFETGKVLQKATLNIKTGKFKQILKWNI